jgi:hypothetical protein
MALGSCRQNRESREDKDMPVLNFKGKTAIETYHFTVPHHTLEFSKKLSCFPKGEEPSPDDNLIIEGDNLLALKALLPTHVGRVKCVFIDPPYMVMASMSGFAIILFAKARIKRARPRQRCALSFGRRDLTAKRSVCLFERPKRHAGLQNSALTDIGCRFACLPIGQWLASSLSIRSGSGRKNDAHSAAEIFASRP